MSSARPSVFWYHFNRLEAKRGSPDVWVVRWRGRNYEVRKVRCTASTETVYRGDSARQPRAYLKGVGHLSISGDNIATLSRERGQGQETRHGKREQGDSDRKPRPRR